MRLSIPVASNGAAGAPICDIAASAGSLPSDGAERLIGVFNRQEALMRAMVERIESGAPFTLADLAACSPSHGGGATASLLIERYRRAGRLRNRRTGLAVEWSLITDQT